MKKLWVIIFLSFIFTGLSAQAPYKIDGVVVDIETGETLIGAGIGLKGARVGAITGLDGTFSLEVPTAGSHTLSVTYLGYEPQEIKASAGDKITVRMHLISNTIEDVVVVGYGTTARKDLTGSVASIDVKDMVKATSTNYEEMIAGKVAGVQITSNDGQPGSEMNFVIRGNNSVTQSNEPLYVVDGFPIEASMGNVLNPDDIETLNILKDASATAIYGARGANGVVLITTKKGTSSKPVFNYKATVGIAQLARRMEMMSPYDFVKYQLELDPAVAYYYISEDKTLDSYKDVEGIDWQDYAYRSALVMNHNFSLRGGNDKTRFSISGLITDQNGILINSGFKKYQGRASITQNLNKKLQFNLNLNYTQHQKYGFVVADNANANYSTSSIMYGLWGYRPVGGVSSQDLRHELFDNFVEYDLDQRVNPIMTLNNTYNPTTVRTFIANSYLQWKIKDNLVWKTNLGYQVVYQTNETFNNSNTASGNARTNSKVNGSIYNYLRQYFSNENTLTYKKDFNKKHRLTAVIGHAFNRSDGFSNGFYAINIPNEALGISGLDEGELYSARTSQTWSSLLSFLGRVEYNYDSRYMLTASFRADGSSKFPKANRWGYFPSVALAWSFGEESWMKNASWLNIGKLRVGYGATGNNRISDFGALTSLEIRNNTGYGGYSGLVPMNLGNDTLKWETTYQANSGVDLAFLKERLKITLDYYYKVTEDLLIYASLAPSSGFTKGYRNIGKVSNNGLEITIDTRNIATNNFIWSTNFNISFNRNKLLALSEDETSMTSAVNWGSYNATYPYIAIIGEPIAMFYGYLYDGLYQISDFDGTEGSYVLKDGIPNNGEDASKIQPGHIRYKDINSDGVIDNNDLTIVGNPNPRFIGGMTNNFTYKNLDLSVFFQWSYGNQILNANRLEFEGATGRKHLNMFAVTADRWSYDNQDATIPVAGGHGPKVYSDRVIEDGSYLRLKSLTLGYNFPKRLLSKFNMRSLRIFVTGSNLFTLTRYSGSDPEVSTWQSALTPGFDWSSYPRPRTVTGGLEVSF